jgi:hypothetical protein
VPALRSRPRIKFRTSVDRARCRRTASRSCRRSGCGCRRPPTPPRACWANDEAGEFSSGVGVFLASRQFVSGLLAEPAPCKVDHVNSLAPGMPVAPVRIVSWSLGRTEHVHIAEAMPATSRRSISRRSTFHQTNPRGCNRTLFPPKYNRETDVLNGLNGWLLGRSVDEIQDRRHHVFAYWFDNCRIACRIPIRAIRVHASCAVGCKICWRNGRLFSADVRFVPAISAASRMDGYWYDFKSEDIALNSHKYVIKSALTRYCSTATACLKISLSRCAKRQVAGKVVTPR